MWLFDKAPSISDFYAAGGRPTWSDWCKWDKHQRAEARHEFEKIFRFDFLMKHFLAAPDLETKIAIADSMKEFDGGDLSRELRKQKNREALS